MIPRTALFLTLTLLAGSMPVQPLAINDHSGLPVIGEASAFVLQGLAVPAYEFRCRSEKWQSYHRAKLPDIASATTWLLRD